MPWGDAMRGEVRETDERTISGGYRRKGRERERAREREVEGDGEKKSMVMQGQQNGQAAATESSTRGHAFLTDEVHWL